LGIDERYGLGDGISIPESAEQALRDILGERLALDGATREAHDRDASHHEPTLPAAVAFPESVEDVASVVQVCAAHGVAIVPYGTGTGIEGGAVPGERAVTLDMGRMNRILSVNVRDMDATVEAGVTRMQLNAHLAEQETGLHFPVDPGANASIGGMAATRASGTAAVRYGTMRENVMGLTVVMADSRVVRTGGRARKSASGYDLTRLFVGSEGTLGVIAEVTVKLWRVPEAVSAAVCAFPDVASAVASVMEVIASGVPMARIELLDEVQMRAVNAYSGLTYAEAPTLFLEFQGTTEEVGDQATRAGDIMTRFGAKGFEWAAGDAERDRLWEARHDGYHASLAMQPGSVGYVTDVCVPLTRLAECIRESKKAVDESGLVAPLYGHVGDGNFHVVALIQPGDGDPLAKARRLGDRIVEIALEMGGTCSGEHGIGKGKIESLRKEHGGGVEVMEAIKKALDPEEIMNPGKVLRMTNNRMTKVGNRPLWMVAPDQ